MKNFVLDTTVVLFDAHALFRFGEHAIIIPITVIEDVDRFSKDITENGRNARQVSRYLDQLRERGSLSEGVTLDSGGTLRVVVETESPASPHPFSTNARDNRILATAMSVREQARDVETVLITKDINLRIKADAFGIAAQDYLSEKIDINELYAGYDDWTVDSADLDAFLAGNAIACDRAWHPHQYLTLIDRNDTTRYAYGKYHPTRKQVIGLQTDIKGKWCRITPRNREQIFAFDALLDPEIQLVTLVGMAGTGKTLLAVAAGLFATVERNTFDRMLVSRPTLPMGKDIGFLPGTVEEKLAPWMYPIADNVELLLRGDSRTHRQTRGFRELVDSGILVIEPLTYIRGRSIHAQYLIVDEAQNLTPHEIKTIITRVGEGTKIILTGDPYQIDNPYIDSSSNGLAYVAEKFKNQDITAHITLTRGERSALSELAANLL